MASDASRRLAEVGLDIAAPFPSRLVGELASRPVLAGRLGLVIGNTRALWPHLARALEREPALRAAPHPVDRYCEERIGVVLDEAPAAHDVIWAHTPPPDAYPVQALAEAAGLCDIAPCRLAVHARFGPWLALRAVAVLDVPGPAEPSAPAGVCASCSAPCRAPFELARAAPGSPESRWRLWLAVRDACPVGREHRYPERQLRYHYTKDRSLLAGG